MGQTATSRRLERAEMGAKALAEARAEEASKERRDEIASWGWNLQGLPPEFPELAQEELDWRLIIEVTEMLYQEEKANGPVKALLPTPDLTAEELAACTDAEVSGYCKGILTNDMVPEIRPHEIASAAPEDRLRSDEMRTEEERLYPETPHEAERTGERQ